MAEHPSGGWWPEEEPERGSGSGPPDEPSEHGEAGEAGESGEGAPDGGPAPPGRKLPRGLASRDRPKIASRYSMFVGFAFVALVIVALLNAFNTEGTGLDGNEGKPIAEFAIPNLLDLGAAGDANIAQDDCANGANPCPADQVRVPACEIETPGAIRICDMFDKPLAISLWFTRGGNCIPSQDAFDQVAAQRSDEVNFLSIDVLDDRDAVATLVAARNWSVPVGHDADGAVSNLLGVAVCPTVVLVYPGGVIDRTATKPGNFTTAEVDDLVSGLVADSAKRERVAGGG